MSAGELRGLAPAKLNLALVVGGTRPDGKHEVLTVLQRVELADEIEVRRSERVEVDGFPHDTIVRAALEALHAHTGVALAARVEKRIPVAAGLGGGSSDAATALRLGNELLGEPLAADTLLTIAAGLGSDVPFFLAAGPQLGAGDGTLLSSLRLPDAYTVLLALPHGAVKASTAHVYGAFDERAGWHGFGERRDALLAALEAIDAPEDLGRLPANDLARSPLAARLESLGAFRADVTGAGPVVYGLFADPEAARAASVEIEGEAATWITRPRWYR